MTIRWADKSFEYGGVQYRVLPMTKRQAFEVFELVRTSASLHSDLPLGTLLPFLTGGPPEGLVESSLILASAMPTSVVNQLREIAWNHLEFQNSEDDWVLMSDDAAEVIIPGGLPPAVSLYWLMLRTLIHHQVGDISSIKAELMPPPARTSNPIL